MYKINIKKQLFVSGVVLLIFVITNNVFAQAVPSSLLNQITGSQMSMMNSAMNKQNLGSSDYVNKGVSVQNRADSSVEKETINNTGDTEDNQNTMGMYDEHRLFRGFDFSRIEKLFLEYETQYAEDPFKNMLGSGNPTQDLKVEIELAGDNGVESSDKVDQKLVLDLKKGNLARKEKKIKEEILENKKQKWQALKEKYQNTPRQFGYDVFKMGFNEAPLSMDVPVGLNYILGPGDMLVIRLWGKLEETLEVTVDRGGKIYLPKVGNVSLAGAKFEDATKIIKKALEKEYVNFDISVTIGQLRTIKVFILGDVDRPGAYDVSSLSTVFMALYLAGGPTKQGSLRNIVLKRKGKAVKTIDLYDYVLYGNRRQDAGLEAFDTIFIPTIGDVAKVEGMVKRPAIFEVSGKASIYDSIKYAGGLSSYAYAKRVQLTRVQEDGSLKIKDFYFKDKAELKSIMRYKSLKNGDVVKLFPAMKEKYNVVYIDGNVFRSGDYEYVSGVTLNTVIERSGLKSGSYLKRVDVYRYVSDNLRKFMYVDFTTEEGRKFRLKDRDMIKVYSEVDVRGAHFVSVEGAVKDPGKYRLMWNMRVLDLTFVAGLDSYAELGQVELFRKTPQGDEKVISINLAAAFQDPKSKHNIKLKHQDRLFLRQDAKYIETPALEVRGQVKYPGKYLIREGEKLSSIFKRAGGFTDKAFLKGCVFKREAVKGRERQGQVRILEEEKKRLIFDQSRLGNMSAETQFLYKEAMSFLEEKIKYNSGRVVIDLKPLSEFKDGVDDVVVASGDAIYVPEIPSSVQVNGGVQEQTSIVYIPGKNCQFYIDRVGGYTQFADMSKYYVIKANGLVLQNANLVERGDIIYVPEQIRVHIDWLDIVTKVAQTVMATITTYKLVTN